MSKPKLVIPRQTKRLVSTLDRQANIRTWDFDNAYPQRIKDLCNASGVATRCIKRYTRFIVGRGFADPLTFKQVVDLKGGTADKLIAMCAKDYAYFGGFAIHFRYNGMGQIVERKYLNFADTRLCSDSDKIAFYDNWDAQSQIKKFNINDIKRINLFNPSSVVDEINECKGDTYLEKVQNYNGQVLWYSSEGFGAYPIAPIDSVAEDVETDYQAKLYKNKNIRTSFTAAGMYIQKGESDSPKERQSTQDALTEFQGADSAGNIMLVEVPAGQEPPEFKQFTVTTGEDRRFEYHESSVERSIVKCFSIPNVLAGVLEAGKLATSSELKDAYDIYNSETEPDRIVFEEQFSKALGKPVSILPLDSSVEAKAATGSDADVPAADVASTALNGAQIASLNEIIANITTGTYPAATGRAIIEASFPFLNTTQIDSIINPLGNAPTN